MAAIRSNTNITSNNRYQSIEYTQCKVLRQLEINVLDAMLFRNDWIECFFRGNKTDMFRCSFRLSTNCDLETISKSKLNQIIALIFAFDHHEIDSFIKMMTRFLILNCIYIFFFCWVLNKPIVNESSERQQSDCVCRTKY